MAQSGRQGSHQGGAGRRNGFNGGSSRGQGGAGRSSFGKRSSGSYGRDGGESRGSYGRDGGDSRGGGRSYGEGSRGGYGRDGGDSRGGGRSYGEGSRGGYGAGRSGASTGGSRRAPSSGFSKYGRDAQDSWGSRYDRDDRGSRGERGDNRGAARGSGRGASDRGEAPRVGQNANNSGPKVRPNSNKPGFGKDGKPRQGSGRGGAGAPKAVHRGKTPIRKSSPAFADERFLEHKGPVNSSPRRAPRRNSNDHELHASEGVRLQKLMAQAGVASRRVCEEMILEGRVEVDGQIVTELGLRVDPETASVHVDGMRLQLNDHLVYFAFNKPRGVVSTMTDPEGRRSISDFVKPSLMRGGERLFHVGRLDQDTEGLLLLTNDGELANRLTHPSYEIPKTYLVQVRGPFPQGIGKQMLAGVELEDGVQRVDSFRLIDSTPGKVLIEVVLHSGKNRIVRRLFDAVGFPVLRLVRVQVGPIGLGDQKQGSIRRLGKQELGHLMTAVGL